MTIPNSDLHRMLNRQASDPSTGYFNTWAMTTDRLALIVVGIIFTLIGSLAIVCRIMLLLSGRRKLWWDDSIMLVAYCFNIGFTISSYVSVRWGVGLQTADAPPDWPSKAIQAVYAIEIFYYFSVYLVKMSLVCLYLRLSIELRNHLFKGSVLLMVTLTLHFISTVVVFAVQCVPMKKYWEPTTPGHCISITGFFYSTNVFTIVTDIIMLALPMRTVWKAQFSVRHKLGIVAAFLSGGLSTLASCIRLYSIQVYTESTEPLRDAAPINTWSFIEINVGICCASAAVIRHFVCVFRQRDRPLAETTNTYSNSDYYSSTATGKTRMGASSPAYLARWPSPGYQEATELHMDPARRERIENATMFPKR